MLCQVCRHSTDGGNGQLTVLLRSESAEWRDWHPFSTSITSFRSLKFSSDLYYHDMLLSNNYTMRERNQNWIDWLFFVGLHCSRQHIAFHFLLDIYWKMLTSSKHRNVSNFVLDCLRVNYVFTHMKCDTGVVDFELFACSHFRFRRLVYAKLIFQSRNEHSPGKRENRERNGLINVRSIGWRMIQWPLGFDWTQ